MIRYTSGNILEAQTTAIVNTVNTVGVMGKGIALAFKKAFPDNFKRYEQAVLKGEVSIGKVFVTETGELSPKFILNFPTKQDWRYPSKLSYIEDGLNDLVKILNENKIDSISIPPLGCGNGKLAWKDVKILIEKYLNPISGHIEILVYEPGYNDQVMVVNTKVSLTPARAMMIYLLDQYRVLGYSITLLVAQKIAYFLQRLGEPLRLEFEKGFYGPYSHQLFHLLKYLNGYFLKFKADENKPGTVIQIQDFRLEEVKEYFNKNVTETQKARIDKLLALIEGFESPYGLELLATTDFVIQQTNTNDKIQIKNEIYNWTNRKKNLMKPAHIEIALERLKQIT